jgi:hypothetical protein
VKAIKVWSERERVSSQDIMGALLDEYGCMEDMPPFARAVWRSFAERPDAVWVKRRAAA